MKLLSKNAASYVDTLKENFVMVDQDARRELISKQLHDIAASKNASIVWDDDLLEEINYLVEWPTALLWWLRRVLFGTSRCSHHYTYERPSTLLPIG